MQDGPKVSSEMLKQAALFFCALTSATPGLASHVKYQMDCDLGKGAPQSQKTEGYLVTLTPSSGSCQVKVLDPQGKTLFEYDAGGIQVFIGLGVTTDGTPNAVIQADTFDPFRLFIVSLGEHSKLLATIENQYGFWLQDDCGGRIRIWTADGAFSKYHDLDDAYHKDLFTPEVVFEIQNGRLVDATPGCREYFDKEISSLRSTLTENDVKNFRSGRITDDFHRGRVKEKILKMVFDYLYTDRQQSAREILQQMWPSDDSERLWQSILKLRSEGILTNINRVH